MAQTQFLNYAGLEKYTTLMKTYIAAADSVVDAKSIKTASYNAETGVLSFFKKENAQVGDTPDYTFTMPVGEVKSLDDALKALAGRVTTVEGTLDTLTGDADTAGSIAAAIKAEETRATGVETTIAAAAATAQAAAEAAQDTADDAIDAIGDDTKGLMGRVKTLETAIGEGGSVSAQIEAAIDDLDKADTAVAGQFVTAVSEEDGIITVSRAALVKTDIPTIDMTQVDGLGDALDDKQDVVVWQSDNYDAATNKAITKSDLDAAVAGLTGATHFIGVKDALPETAKSGDICIVGVKEYIYDGTKWNELGDESIYAVKGDIVNADIADNAAIAQSKVAGLVDALADKATVASVTALENTVNGTDDADGLVKKVADLEAAVGEGGSVASQITAAIEALDSDASQTAGTDGLALAVELVDGKVTSISGSIAANTYDAYGAASDVLGEAGDTASDATVYGAKAYADSLAGNYATAAQGTKADTALQPADIGAIADTDIDKLFEVKAD